MPRAPKAPTPKQAKFINEVKKRTRGGNLPTNADLAAAAEAAYDISEPEGDKTKRSVAASMAGELMRKPHIQKALGLNEDGKTKFMETVFNCLQGMDPQHPQDKDLKKAAMNILARYFVPSESHTVIEDDRYAGRSTEDIEFFVMRGHWPEEKPDAVMMPIGEA
jgi:hypothetical protein